MVICFYQNRQVIKFEDLLAFSLYDDIIYWINYYFHVPSPGVWDKELHLYWGYVVLQNVLDRFQSFVQHSQGLFCQNGHLSICMPPCGQRWYCSIERLWGLLSNLYFCKNTEGFSFSIRKTSAVTGLFTLWLKGIIPSVQLGHRYFQTAGTFHSSSNCWPKFPLFFCVPTAPLWPIFVHTTALTGFSS